MSRRPMSHGNVDSFGPLLLVHCHRSAEVPTVPAHGGTRSLEQQKRVWFICHTEQYTCGVVCLHAQWFE
jgi:hypothetical protein